MDVVPNAKPLGQLADSLGVNALRLLERPRVVPLGDSIAGDEDQTLKRLKPRRERIGKRTRDPVVFSLLRQIFERQNDEPGGPGFSAWRAARRTSVRAGHPPQPDD